MKSLKTNSLQRLLSFLLIAVLLVCVIGFAASGWQSETKDEPDSGKVDDSIDKTDENTDGNQENSDMDESETVILKYTDALTGYETTEEASRERPIAYILNPSAPLYSISAADIAVEIPTEDGDTRFVAISSGIRELGKIGSLSATRNYISNIASDI